MQLNYQHDKMSDSLLLIEETKLAVQGINKNSRLRIHYIKLVMMNNIMRAFITHYDIQKDFVSGQLALLETLKRVESSKTRSWSTADKICLQQAFTLFCSVMEAVDNEQLLEIMQYVESNANSGKWLIYAKK